MSVLDLIYPKKCFGCKTTGFDICPTCINRVPLSKQVCIECDRPSVDGLTHVGCKKKYSADGLVSIWRYAGLIKYSLLKLKYRYVYSISSDLARYSSVFLLRSINALPKSAILLPIPLYRTRKNLRGFNQTEEIGKLVAKHMRWNCRNDLLLRVKKAKIQSELNKEERKKNVQGIFSLNPYHHLLSTNYILFDDVCTTGSTIKEACKILKKNGIDKVWGLTIAR